MLLQLIIIQAITFVAIVFALKRLLYTETTKEAIRLRALKAENAVKQRELQEKISASETTYKDKLTKAEEDVRRLKTQAQDEVAEAKKKILDEAKEEAERIVRIAFNKKERIREEVKVEIERKLPRMASRIFEEALLPEARKVVHENLLKELAAHIEKIEKSKFSVKEKKGELISAYPLGSQEKNKLISGISLKIGHKIDFEETEDKKLIAGCVIRLGTLAIDGSLEYRLRQIEVKS